MSDIVFPGRRVMRKWGEPASQAGNAIRRVARIVGGTGIELSSAYVMVDVRDHQERTMLWAWGGGSDRRLFVIDLTGKLEGYEK